MADLNDLGYKSISDMTPDEAIEHLRQIRLSRLTQKKSTKKSSTKSKSKSKNATPVLSQNQAQELLKLLGE